MCKIAGLCCFVAILFGDGSAIAESLPPAAMEVRTWTTADGRAFQGGLMKVEGSRLTLRLATGQITMLSVQRLSPRDQLFVQQSISGSGAAGRVRVPVEKRVWPEKVEVDTRAIDVKFVDEEGGLFRYRSQNFQFTAEDKIAGSVMKEVARIFEATRSLVQALPWGIDPTPPQDLGFYQAKFYVNRSSYERDGGPANSGGVYFSRDRVFRVPFASLGLIKRGQTWFMDRAQFSEDTVIHEITHQMMHDFLPFLPTWVTEGSADYTEMLPFNAGRFLSGSHRRGIKDYIEKGSQRGNAPSRIGSVTDFMKMTNEQWHKTANVSSEEQHRMYFGACMLVYYFSHLDGDGKGTRFLRYMDKMADARDAWSDFFADPKVEVAGDGSYRYSDIQQPAQSRTEEYGLSQLDILIDGRTPEQLQNDVESGFKKIGVRW